MNKSADYCSHDFDYQADFTQFLEEAKRSTFQKAPTTPQVSEKQLNPAKKNRKSWKKSLFYWLKIDKKDKKPGPNIEKAFKPKNGHVSGPVHPTTGKNTTSRARRPASGPITSIFSPTKGADEYDRVPYVCLGQISDPHKVQSYGPVYLVT
ncbi:Unknown protein [Striga hermonthica]|uniref:Uncharacterized protein n=1 Tax=Striga hermonthica TaxID=68872 RepID=A0A9N7RHC4_STRHE|nr:Unknown protein [Striga hermonthica]